MNNNPLIDNQDESAALLYEADAIENSQQAMLESSAVELEYNNILESYIQQKHNQVERIESKLTQLLQKQQVKADRIRSAKPNFFSLPKAVKTWRNQLNKQVGIIAKIESRLTFVKDIRSSMGLHEPRIEELASRKLRLNEPSLYEEYCKKMEKERALENQTRSKERERKQVKKTTQSITLAKSSPI